MTEDSDMSDVFNDTEYDVLLNVASWPSQRIAHWDTLLKARAIENQAYVIGVNRVGKDGNEIPFTGSSMTYDPLGKPLSAIVSGKETICHVKLQATALEKIRKGLPFFKDADHFNIDN